MTVILAAACRTPFVAANGALAGWHPVDLSALVLTEAIERADLSAGQVDEVWVGCAEPVGAQGADMARASVLTAGWPDTIGGTVIDRAETSGNAALHGAAAAIAAGTITTAVVLGVCSASIVQPGASALGRTYGRPWGDGPAARMEDRGGLLPPARAAEVAALAAGFNRDAQDRAGIRSHELRAEVVSPAMMTIDARTSRVSAKATPTQLKKREEKMSQAVSSMAPTPRGTSGVASSRINARVARRPRFRGEASATSRNGTNRSVLHAPGLTGG